MIPRLTELQPATRATRAFLAALARAGFSGDLADDLATRVVGATDNSIYQILPQAILYPRTRDDVCLVMKTAAAEPYRALTLTARGGGTGTNGQSLTSGLVLDVGRHMNRILGRDVDRVLVEPGVVLDQLNAHLAPDGVFFAPNLSPSSRATLGGMVSTDASGQGSRVYGKTSQHVHALEVVLVDGSVLTTRAMRRDEVLAMPAWDAPAPLAERLPRAVLTLAEKVRPDFVAKLPRLHRFLTGYDLERVWDPETDTRLTTWETVHHLIRNGFSSRNKGDDFAGMMYAAFQERATRITHGNVGKMATKQGSEPLARICRRIAGDEARHETFYTKIVGQAMDNDPEAGVLAFRSILRGIIAMPGRKMFDGQDPDLFDHFAVVSQRTGAYTSLTYAEIIEHLVATWGIAHRSLTGKAAKAQDYLCQQADRYKFFADEITEKLSKQPQTNFTWIHGGRV